MTIQVRRRVRVLAAACAVALTLASPAARAWPGVHPPDDTENPVITWDLNAQMAIWDVANQQPWAQGRSFAMVHGAIYGFGAFATAQRTIQGDGAMHMLHKGQIKGMVKGDVLAQNRVINQLFGVAA